MKKIRYVIKDKHSSNYGRIGIFVQYIEDADRPYELKLKDGITRYYRKKDIVEIKE